MTGLRRLSLPVYVVNDDAGNLLYTNGGVAHIGAAEPGQGGYRLRAILPALHPRMLGDGSFCRDHRIRFPYMSGAMANGIASTRLVKAVAGADLLGSFGAAGLMPDQVEQAIVELKGMPGGRNFCFNLIHSPNEKGHEDRIVDLYLKYGIRLVETSAYMALTLPVVRYRVHGIHVDKQGNVVTPNRIIAKCSRIEVATHWFSPPPAKLLAELVARKEINEAQAQLAARIPMAQDLTVEADSGGHTDNRPAITLIPTIIALRDRLQHQFNYAAPLRVGAAGGIATPASAAAAFAMGAAYIVTGTINQACIESGSSDIARRMLAEAGQADVAMAPAVDMFELGVKLQVLKRGTMFAMRGNKLYEIYKNHAGLEDIAPSEREQLEKSIFKMPLEQVWKETRAFFMERDPAEVERAERDRKHRMALVFRWYLGLSSRWANAGVAGRQVDYQIWCGPAMGAFNEWTRGTPLEEPENRKVVDVALNIMYGAALIMRLNQLRVQGVATYSDMKIEPLPKSEIESYLS
jgi:PfaD family protein